jgi:hypothetical protein
MITEKIFDERTNMYVEPDMDWHVRMIDRILSRNADATIKDYLKICDTFDGIKLKPGERTMEIKNFRPYNK